MLLVPFLFSILITVGCNSVKRCPEPIGTIDLLDCTIQLSRVNDLKPALQALTLPSDVQADLQDFIRQFQRGCQDFNACHYDDTDYQFRRHKLITIVEVIEETLKSHKDGLSDQETLETIRYVLRQARQKPMFSNMSP